MKDFLARQKFPVRLRERHDKRLGRSGSGHGRHEGQRKTDKEVRLISVIRDSYRPLEESDCGGFEVVVAKLNRADVAANPQVVEIFDCTLNSIVNAR